MKNFIYLLVALIIIVFIAGGISFLGKQNIIQNAPTESTSSSAKFPTAMAEKVYTNKNLGLSLKYPTNYTMEDLTLTNKDALLALSFYPAIGDKNSPILVTVLPTKNSPNLSSWIQANTTSSGYTSAGNHYFLYQVSHIIYKTINGKQAAVFTIGDPNIADPLVANLFMSNRFVVFVAQQTQKIGIDYQKMLSSLTF